MIETVTIDIERLAAMIEVADEVGTDPAYDVARVLGIWHGATEHRGDCTKEAFTCILCHRDNAIELARDMLGPHGSVN